MGVSDRGVRPEPLVVGIGAPAGSEEALRSVLAWVRRAKGLSYVVAGPAALVAALDERDRATHAPESAPEAGAIDALFGRLARTGGRRAAVVLLRGAGSDGTRGLEAVRASGGLAVVQAAEEAEGAAVETRGDEIALSLAEIRPALLAFAQAALRASPTGGSGERSEHALRESEERLQLILRAAAAGAWQFEHETGRIALDENARSIFGLAEEAVRPEEIWRIILREDRKRLLREVTGVVDRGPQQPVTQDYRIRTGDGRVHWLQVRGQAFFEGEGADRRLVRAVGVVLDITARKEDEEALRQKSEALEREDRRKEQFLATLGHELRNPLAALHGAIELLRQGLRSGSDLAPLMSSQIAQMTHLVDDLLDVARINHGKIALRPGRVDLAGVVETALEAIRPRVAERGQELVLRATAGLVLRGDATRLAQVATNLLSNASSYSPPGTRIEVILRREGDEAVLIVQDEGRGIGQDRLESIFEPFTQEDPQGRGLGIGLALVKSLVGLHGGSVRAESDGPGRGSRFTVRLPIRAPEEEPAAKTSVTAAPAAASGARVLVVDDLRDNADVLALLLGGQGIEAECAYTGADGVAKAASWCPDAALIDIGLPDMTGFEVAERIRSSERGHELLLLAVTGFGDADTERRAREAGFDARLLKPVDHEKLCALLRAHLERSRA